MQASKAFFLKALEPLGVAVVSGGAADVRCRALRKKAILLHCVCAKPRRNRRIYTWRSRPRNRRQVEAFYRAALEAGGKDNGAPGLRPRITTRNYYAAFVIAPDGHNIEAGLPRHPRPDHEHANRLLQPTFSVYEDRKLRWPIGCQASLSLQPIWRKPNDRTRGSQTCSVELCRQGRNHEAKALYAD